MSDELTDTEINRLYSELDETRRALAGCQAKLDALRGDRDALRKTVSEWEAKAATWLASPEAAKRLEGYRELGQRSSLRKWAPIFGLAGQSGMFALSVAYTVVWAVGAWNQWARR
jgi:hypothetical protein